MFGQVGPGQNGAGSPTNNQQNFHTARHSVNATKTPIRGHIRGRCQFGSETQDLAQEMGSSSFKELKMAQLHIFSSKNHGTGSCKHLRKWQILQRQPRITMVIMMNAVIRQDCSMSFSAIGISKPFQEGCQTHFHWGPHQPRGCLQRAEHNCSSVTVKEQLHLYSPKITFGHLKATTRLMWPPVKMSLTPLLYALPWTSPTINFIAFY